MAYDSRIRSIQEWLRRHVRRDSLAWRALYSIKQRGLRMQEKRHARAWAEAEARFDRVLGALADSRPDFFFIQVGAHDGGMDDPLAPWIARRGWRGLFVEPQPEQFARLRARHAGQEHRFLFENVAIDREAGSRSLFRVAEEHLHTPEMSGLASLLPDRALATHAALGRTTRITVPCLPLSELLERHRIERVDLLQIDTEGYDAVVLETLDLARVRPALIHYEHRHLSGSEQKACARRLRAHGYEVVMKRHDAFALRRD